MPLPTPSNPPIPPGHPPHPDIPSPWSTRRRGLCLVLAGPSGAGKSSLARALLRQDPTLTLSVSATTRAPRPGERDGIDYHFLSEARFAHLDAAGELLESAGVHGRRYGTPRAPVLAALAAGTDVLFDIDWQGHRSLRAALPGDIVSIFLLPPDLTTLRTRLLSRGTDAPDDAERRLAIATAEIAHWREFDHLVINRVFEDCLATVTAILAAARCATARLENSEACASTT
jgi:guanylate kinase